MKKYIQRMRATIADAKRTGRITQMHNEKGFTLLELLVVVAILAAIAGTATISLQDTDARASAAAHVAMMDELQKGVRTFRVLQRNILPNNLDSLAHTAVAGSADAAVILPQGDGEILAVSSSDVAVGDMVDDQMDDVMAEIGMTQLRYIDQTPATLPDGVAVGGCSPVDGVLQVTIADRGNAVVGGNIFNGAAGNGCGESITLGNGSQVAYWHGAIERIMGPGAYDDAYFTPGAGATAGTMTATAPADGAVAPILLAVGFGPSSNLFNANELGGMTSVPSYRHVAPDQYSRFIGFFQVGESTYDLATTAWLAPVSVDQISFIAVVDGAGDTKEEELGEWDGTRNTI